MSESEGVPRKSTSQRAALITSRAIDAASAKARAAGRDEWLTDPAPRGAGRMLIRCLPSGARRVMFRYTREDGSRDTLAIADYDSTRVRGIDLAEARQRAGALTRMLQDGVRDLRGHLDAADAARAAERAAASDAEARRDKISLAALCDAYVDSLAERPSQGDVRSAFKLHVKGACPELAARPAKDIEPQEFRDLLAKLVAAGKGRAAAKLRSHLRAAYSLAISATLDPSVPVASGEFGVTVNPLAAVASLAKFNKTRDRALTLPELRAFWTRVKARPSTAARDACMSALLLGGQRPVQLLRLERRDVDIDAAILTLRDLKGRTRAMNPRRHVLPIMPELLPILEARCKSAAKPDSPVFSAVGNDVALRKETLSDFVAMIVGEMEVAKELEHGRFELRDLRRTAETHLAALRVSKDIRAQLQSHGLGGVQDKSYDRHDYADEKREALRLWIDRLNSRPADVRELPSAKRPKGARRG